MFPRLDLSAEDISRDKRVFEAKKMPLPQFIVPSVNDKVKLYQVITPDDWGLLDKKDGVDISITSLSNPRELKRDIFDMRFESLNGGKMPGLWAIKSAPVRALQVKIPFICRDENDDMETGGAGDYVISGIGGFNIRIEKDDFENNYLNIDEPQPNIVLKKIDPVMSLDDLAR